MAPRDSAGADPLYEQGHFVMQAMMGARAEGLHPVGSERGIIDRETALEAVLQIAAITDEWMQSGLLPKGKALHIMLMLMAIRERIAPLPDAGDGENDLRADLEKIASVLREATEDI